MKKSTVKKRAIAFNHLFDSVIITDEKGIITDWNKASEELFGHSKAAAIGQHINIIHAPEDSDKVTLDVIASISKTGEWKGKVKSLHQNGTMGWVESKCIAIYNSEDELIATVGINKEIPGA
ncbi:MAG: PAS domain S-box protein [Pseudomonadota bacterium]